MGENFVDEFVSVVSGATDAPMNSIYAGAYWLISSTIGFWANVKDTPAISTRCNLFTLISGKAGISRKSTVMDYALLVNRTAWRKLYDYLGIKVRMDDKFIEEYTVEGICDQIEDIHNLGISDFHICVDEFGVWLNRAGSTHLLGSKGLLSKFYYGKGYKQALSARGGKQGKREIPDGLYWTLIAGMQDPELYLDEDDIKQGFMRRILFVHVTEDDARDYKPPLSERRRNIYNKLVEIGENIGDTLITLYKFADGFEPVDTFFTGSVMDAINDYDLDNYNMIKSVYSVDSIISRYMATAWEHVLKITVLHFISRSDISNKLLNIAGVPNITIDDMESFKTARDWFDGVRPRIFEALENISVHKSHPQHPDVSQMIARIKGILSRNDGVLKSNELLKKLDIHKSIGKQYVITMMERTELFVVYRVPNKNKGGRPSFYFYNDHNKAEEYINNAPHEDPYATVRLLNLKQVEDLW